MRYELSVRFSLNDDGIVVRARRKLLKRINVIWAVQSPLQKYFASPVGRIISTNSRHPTPQRGVSRSSRTRGGMRWTRQRFACEVIAGRVERPVSDQQHADERCFRGRQNRVVLTPRRWRQVRGGFSALPGSDKTLIRGRRWQKSPVTGESTTYAVKTIAQGMPGVPGYLW